MIRLQKWIVNKFCKAYIKALLQELSDKNTQIANLKAINQILRENNNQLQLTMKGLIQ